MKKLFYIFSALLLICCKTSNTLKFNATGTYTLGNYEMNSNKDVVGQFGKIQVHQLNSEKILMTFMINRGAPNYNSGSFVDTLSLENKVVIYTSTEFDKACKITFVFDKAGVNVNQEVQDSSSGCGFGNGVVAKGYYKKSSSDTPVLRHPMTNDKI